MQSNSGQDDPTLASSTVSITSVPFNLLQTQINKTNALKEMEMNQNLIFRNLKKRLWSKSISTTPRNKRIL
jgi:hypothetical protein